MKRTVAIGRQNFASIREGNFFILIKQTLLRSGGKVETNVL